MKIFKYDLRFNTLFRKGLKPIDDRFGCIFITGRQGSGKNYMAIMLALKQLSSDMIIKTNIHSLNIPNTKIFYFSSVNQIYFDTDEYCIYIIDELSRKYDKNSRTDTQLYAFLNQCRKRHRIVIMITQEWKELPMWLRRPARYMITTKPVFLLSKFGIYRSIVGDAANMVLDKDTMEWECPPIYYIFYKRNQYIANMYDTFEPINML